MKQSATVQESDLILKTLAFQMHIAGYSQNAIAAYLGKGNDAINKMLKPLQKKKGKAID